MLSNTLHRNIYLFGVFSAPFGIMLGHLPGSLPIVILAANWLLERNFKQKWFKLKSNLLFWSFLSLFLLQLIGLASTENFNEAVNEIRIALPLLILPIVFLSSAPLSQKELHYTLYAFVMGCLINTVWCIAYGYFIHPVELGRNLSRFMSHIRLGLFIDLVIAVCFYFLRLASGRQQKLFWFLLIAYFIFTLFILGLASGLLIFVSLALLFFIGLILKKHNAIKFSGLIGIILFLGFGGNYIKHIKDEQLNISKSNYNLLKQVNSFGRPLLYFDSLGAVENGNYVLRNIQLEDLKRTWNARVPTDTFSFKPEHNLIRYYVLLRYLSSAQLSKDAEGINQLNHEDIGYIQKNITNQRFPHWSFLHKRIYELVNEYDDYKNAREVNGHSLAMRMKFWKASFILIKENPILGTGTGDTQEELNKIYKKQFPELDNQFYKRPHNQFLSFAVTFGLFGLFIFLWVLIYPIVYLNKQLMSLYWVFLFILLCSFITEDTLGTQAGMAFYCIFNLLFCTDAFFKKQQNPEGLLKNH